MTPYLGASLGNRVSHRVLDSYHVFFSNFMNWILYPKSWYFGWIVIISARFFCCQLACWTLPITCCQVL